MELQMREYKKKKEPTRDEKCVRLKNYYLEEATHCILAALILRQRE